MQSTSDVAPGAAVGLVLEATSFYAEAGGQTADTGAIAASAGSFDVEVRQISRVWAASWLAGWLLPGWWRVGLHRSGLSLGCHADGT